MEKKRGGYPYGFMTVQWGAILRPSRRASYNKSRRGSAGSNEGGGIQRTEEKSTRIEMLVSKAGNRIVSAVKGLVKRVENIRGVETIKDFLLGGYQRLPKASSFQLFSCGAHKVHQTFGNHRHFYNDSDGFYAWSTEDEDIGKSADCTPRKDVTGTDRREKMTGSFLNFGRSVSRKEDGHDAGKLKQAAQEKCKASVSCSAKSRAEARRKLEQTLREIVMEHNSWEDVVDIEEFLHCYSGLTSPLYIDMVNQFFMDIFREFLPAD